MLPHDLARRGAPDLALRAPDRVAHPTVERQLAPRRHELEATRRAVDAHDDLVAGTVGPAREGAGWSRALHGRGLGKEGGVMVLRMVRGGWRSRFDERADGRRGRFTGDREGDAGKQLGVALDGWREPRKSKFARERRGGER